MKEAAIKSLPIMFKRRKVGRIDELIINRII